MRKFKKILESKDQIDEIREHLYPIEDFGYEVIVVASKLMIDQSDNKILSMEFREDYLNSYVFVISKPRFGVIVNNEHLGLYSNLGQSTGSAKVIPIIDLSPTELNEVIGLFLSAVNRLKENYNIQWSICSLDQFLIIVDKESL